MFWQMASMWQLSVPSTHSSTSARGEAGGSDGESRGEVSPISPWEPSLEVMKPSSPPAFQPAHEAERLEGTTLPLCSLVALLHPALTQRLMGSLWDTVSR